MTKYERLNKEEYKRHWFLDEVVYSRSLKKWVAITSEGQVWFEGSYEEMLDMLEFVPDFD